MTPTVAIVRRIIERDGPIILGDIATLAGVTRRDAERAVQELRLAGEPIIDEGTKGLRFTDDPDVLGLYIRSRRERAQKILAATRPLRATQRRLQQRDGVLWRHLA